MEVTASSSMLKTHGVVGIKRVFAGICMAKGTARTVKMMTGLQYLD